MTRRNWLLVLLLFCSFSVAQAAPVAIPPLKTRVTDLTGTLDAGRRTGLEQRLAALEQRKGAQIAVLLIPTTGEESIEQYAVRVFETWKLGRKDVDDGVLLLVAKKDRTVRIEVGYGLEGAVSDALASRIINEQIVPRFRAGDFADGIEAGAGSLIGLIDGEALPAPVHEGESGPVSFFLIVLSAGLFVVQFYYIPRFVRRCMGDRADKRPLLREGFNLLLFFLLPIAYIGALNTLRLTSADSIFFGSVASFLYIWLLCFRFIRSQPPSSGEVGKADDRPRSSSDRWSSDSWSSSSSSSSSSSGGFSGGGGSSGGGGASGRW